MSRTPQLHGEAACAWAHTLDALQCAFGAAALFRRTLAAATETELMTALGQALSETTCARHAFILLRSGNVHTLAFYRSRDTWSMDSGRLQQQAPAVLRSLRAVTPRLVAYEGQQVLALPLCADGRHTLGALCIALADDSMVDVAALTALASCGAERLQRLREIAEEQRWHDLLRHQLSIFRDMTGNLVDEPGILRTVIDQMPDMIFAKDRNGRFVFANRAAALCIAGQSDPLLLIGKSDLDFYGVEQGQRYFTDEQQIIRTGVPITDQVEENVSAAGIRRFFSTTKVPVRDDAGNVVGIVGISRDVTLRVGCDEALRLCDRALESSQDGIVICGAAPDHQILYTNPAFERITGFTRVQAQRSGIGRFLIDRGGAAGPPADAPTDVDADVDASVDDIIAELIELAELGERRLVRCARANGEPFVSEVRLAVIRAADGAPTHSVFTIADVTAAHLAEEKLARLASHDALTGLPNRRLLMERLNQAVSVAERGGLELSVAFIDLDGLKQTNDEHGHEAGDLLLCTVADRIAGAIRQSDTIARLGGDEFVLVTLHAPVPETERRGAMLEVLTKIQELIGQPIRIGGRDIAVTCSIGVSRYGRHGGTAAELLRHADTAMYAAKKSGRNRIVFCEAEA